MNDRLSTAMADAQQQWPGVHVDPDTFVAHLTKHLERDHPEAALDKLRTGDLYLACACIAGDNTALEAFERYCMPAVEAALARIEGIDRDEVCQALRDKMLVGEAGGRPRLEDYGGRGELRAFVRVAAVRLALNMQRKHHRETSSDEQLAQIADSGDVEMGYLKAVYRDAFKRAFQESLEELDLQERNLLRSHLLDSLSIDALGALYGIHRSTAARRLAEIRNKLQRATRGRLRDRLQIEQSELDSIERLVLTHFDASVRRVLEGWKTEEN